MADWYNAARVAQPGSVILADWNAARQKAKAQQAPQVRRFAAAKIDRLTASFQATSNSINQELRDDLDRLRARARSLVKNNDYGRKFAKMVVANIVGPNGFGFQSRVMNSPTQPDKLAADAIESHWAAWGEPGVCDITGRMGFTDFCRALLSAVAPDGEFMVRKIRVR